LRCYRLIISLVCLNLPPSTFRDWDLTKGRYFRRPMGGTHAASNCHGYAELDEHDGLPIQEREAVYCSRRCCGVTSSLLSRLLSSVLKLFTGLLLPIYTSNQSINQLINHYQPPKPFIHEQNGRSCSLPPLVKGGKVNVSFSIAFIELSKIS
jgi:hypothetical protein